MSEEKTSWRKSKREQSCPFAPAELSKLSKENGTGTNIEGSDKLHMYFNIFAHLCSSRKT